jgi:Flp pilus assembly protein TadB
VTLAGALIAGAGFGLGLVLLVRALRPGPVPLATALTDLNRPATSQGTSQTGDFGWRHRVAEATARLVDRGGLASRLRILDVTVEQHALTKVTLAAAGLALPVLVAAVAWAGGVAMPPGAVAVASIGLAAVAFVWPDIGLTDRIERRRRAFRHALSAYLDLVTILLAGGAGLETALHAAADSGDGWAFTEIRRALHGARIIGRTPWDGFADLGHQLGIDALVELAASAHLAGDQGARIRASLTAKADTLRAHQTAAIEAQAEAATEKMLLPVVALVVGMILFVGYGVTEAISTPDPTTLTPPGTG